jgi:4-hydroxythreonine-4-phosphate dehydrogenase
MIRKPIIAISMGDPAGIGPELIIKVLSHEAIHENCSPFVVGDPKVMSDICEMVGAGLRIKAIEELPGARFSPSVVNVLCPEGVHIEHVPLGKVDPKMGRAAALCLGKAFELAMDNQVQGVVSAPLNKEAFHLAGYKYADELEYLADITKSRKLFMFGVANSIWTVMVTEHIAFKEIVNFIDKDRILEYIEKMHGVLIQVGISDPRIAVAALNVHAGEGGLLGHEEIDEIEPAIQKAKQQGLNVQGPAPADTVFVRALEGDFDGIVFMYHDQANIARKLQPREKGATFFIGLPVPCGTTAHGTAFDKAGKGIADPGSLAAALKYTIRLASLTHG